MQLEPQPSPPILDAARLVGAEKQARLANKRSKSTRDLLQNHITSCDAKQTWVLRIGLVTMTWVMLHSPEAAKAAAEIAKVLFP